MAYTTTAGLSARLGAQMYARLTDRVNGQTANDSVAQQMVDEAEALVDSYLARRYATPIDVSGDAALSNVLESRTLDVAEYLAWRGSPFVGDVSERIRSLKEEALRWLEQVASGLLELPATARPGASTMLGATAMGSGEERCFTHEQLEGM